MAVEPVEIRLLGRLSVRRVDGTFVDNNEWRTGKTADLLRLLALAGGRPVQVETLLNRLWPNVDENRARASLRTAASQIRRTVGIDCVQRCFDGLALQGAWVDVSAFTTLAGEARECARRSDHARVVQIAREAEALYVGDLDGSTSDHPWVVGAREGLASRRRELLNDAAASAFALRWLRDAVDFGQLALSSDPLGERPHRLLMMAYAGLGETERALKVYEHCRQMLAEELGADPSPATQSVHLEVLCGSMKLTTPFERSIFPPASRVDRLARRVEELAEGGAHGVMSLIGISGVGRCELATAVTETLAARGWRVRPVNDRETLTSALDAGRPGDRTLVLLGATSMMDPAMVQQLVSAHDPRRTGTVVCLVPVASQSQEPPSEVSTCRLTEVEVLPLDPRELDLVVQDALSDRLTERATGQLRELTGGRFSDVIETLASWVYGGRLVETADGLDLVEPSLPRQLSAFWTPLQGLPPTDLDTAAALALLGSAATAERVTGVLCTDPVTDDVDATGDSLDRLVDQGILRADGHGYAFRHPLVRDAAANWLRPSRRRRLHARIAETAAATPEEAARHWMRAARPRRAITSLLDAADHAARRHPERAHRLVATAFRYARSGAWQATDQIDALRAVTAAAGGLGLADLSRQARSRADALVFSGDSHTWRVVYDRDAKHDPNEGWPGEARAAMAHDAAVLPFGYHQAGSRGVAGVDSDVDTA